MKKGVVSYWKEARFGIKDYGQISIQSFTYNKWFLILLLYWNIVAMLFIFFKYPD